MTHQAAVSNIAGSRQPARGPTAIGGSPDDLRGPTRAMDPRTLRMLQGRIAPTLMKMAAPTVSTMLVRSSMSLIQIWFVSRLGVDPLAGISLVFPGWMLMQALSAGSLGGGISSSIARSLGAGRKSDADALVWHVVIISLAIGALFGGLVLAFGGPIYRTFGGVGGSLQEALIYSNIAFLAMPFIWLTNGLASVIRGTGNMAFPATVVFLGLVAQILLSPLFIFGYGPIAGMGIAGAAVAVLLTNAGAAGPLCWYLLGDRSIVRLSVSRPQWAIFTGILSAGTVASISALQTSVTIILLTALVGRMAGPDAVAGYGIGVRLEYQLLAVMFGLGAPLVAMVGTNIGGQQRDRAVAAGLTGGLMAFVLCEVIGVAVAVWPDVWLGLFSHNQRMVAAGEAYLRYAGVGYGFLALGGSLFFASQGAM